MTKGKFGALPEDYVLMKAAQWLRIPATDLETIPIWYLYKAVDYMSAEAEAEEQLANQK